jgi:hypothetical protein
MFLTCEKDLAATLIFPAAKLDFATDADGAVRSIIGRAEAAE